MYAHSNLDNDGKLHNLDISSKVLLFLPCDHQNESSPNFQTHDSQAPRSLLQSQCAIYSFIGRSHICSLSLHNTLRLQDFSLELTPFFSYVRTLHTLSLQVFLVGSNLSTLVFLSVFRSVLSYLCYHLMLSVEFRLMELRWKLTTTSGRR